MGDAFVNLFSAISHHFWTCMRFHDACQYCVQFYNAMWDNWWRQHADQLYYIAQTFAKVKPALMVTMQKLSYLSALNNI